MSVPQAQARCAKLVFRRRHERVIQEMYRRFGRQGVAMTANVISFRGRSTMREIGKALNLSTSGLDLFSSLFHPGDLPQTLEPQDHFQPSGLEKAHPRARACVELYQSIHGLPRHLGQHSGGMVVCQNPMEDRAVAGGNLRGWRGGNHPDDKSTQRLTTGPHPMKLMREYLAGVWSARAVSAAPHGDTITIAGAAVTPDLFERERLTITRESFLRVTGPVQTRQGLPLVRAERIERLACPLLEGLASHDFH